MATGTFVGEIDDGRPCVQADGDSSLLGTLVRALYVSWSPVVRWAGGWTDRLRPVAGWLLDGTKHVVDQWRERCPRQDFVFSVKVHRVRRPLPHW